MDICVNRCIAAAATAAKGLAVTARRQRIAIIAWAAARSGGVAAAADGCSVRAIFVWCCLR